jgi:hypothetical protein
MIHDMPHRWKNMLRLILVASLLLVTAAWGQERWTLTMADFRSEPVVLKALDSSGAKVAPAAGGDERPVAMEQFLLVHRSLPLTPPSGRFVLHMVGGDKIGGEPVSLKGESLVWKSTALGEISIPTSRLVAITPPDKPAPQERKREDVVTLGNGDAVHGIIASLSADKIAVQTDAGNSDVPMSSVAAVTFAATPSAGSDARAFRVRLDDGSSLVGPEVKLEGDTLHLTLGKNEERKLAIGHVAAIEQVNGPVSWLSSRTPTETVYFPFFGTSPEPPARMDRSWTAREIAFKDHVFAHGIGVHAYSRISWPLDGKFEAFRTRFAVDGDSPEADLTVRVKLDDKIVFEQEHVRAGVLSPVVLQDLASAKKLTLEVDGGTGYVEDRLNWIEPALLKKKPAEVPTPAPATQQ